MGSDSSKATQCGLIFTAKQPKKSTSFNQYEIEHKDGMDACSENEHQINMLLHGFMRKHINISINHIVFIIKKLS